jgi:hypothetical protein
MYKEGIKLECEGDAVEVEDDGKGSVQVTTKESGKEVIISISPK